MSLTCKGRCQNLELLATVEFKETKNADITIKNIVNFMRSSFSGLFKSDIIVNPWFLFQMVAQKPLRTCCWPNLKKHVLYSLQSCCRCKKNALKKLKKITMKIKQPIKRKLKWKQSHLCFDDPKIHQCFFISKVLDGEGCCCKDSRWRFHYQHEFCGIISKGGS